MGTRTHDDDLMLILPALRAVCERHPGKVEIQLVGVAGRAETNEALKGLPVRFTLPRAEEVEYPLFMLWFTSRVHWDIALAPLEDTLFNQCKSDIKFLDYSAIGAAGVYSRVAAYASSVQHKETGWLAENEVGAWETALEELISNDQLRMQLAQQATWYLFSRRVLLHSVQHWSAALSNLAGNTKVGI
jgi:hypothetical protein